MDANRNTTTSTLGDAIERFGDLEAIDGLADQIHGVLGSMPDGPMGVLRGRWLGHPAHPMLTDLPIGFWTSAWILDLVGGRRTERAADTLVGLGVISAVPAVVTGWADWSTRSRRDRRIGVVHAVSNGLATSAFAASWLARRRGDRARGIALGHVGAAIASIGGALGGHLAFVASAADESSSDRTHDGSTGAGVPNTGRIEAQAPSAEETSHAQVAGAPSDNTTVTGILADLRAEGFEADLSAVGDRGEVRCSACGTTSSAADLTDLVERRLEGASDPDDMVLAVGARCPACSATGAMVLSYGPAAGEADAAVVVLLP